MSMIPDNWDGADVALCYLAVGVAVALVAMVIGVAIHEPTHPAKDAAKTKTEANP